MRGGTLAAVLLCVAQALAWGAVAPAQAQVSDAPPLTPQLSPPSLDPSIKPLPPPPEVQTARRRRPRFPRQPLRRLSPRQMPRSRPDSRRWRRRPGPRPADPVVAAIRSKLADPAIRKDADAGDFAALEAFYAARTGGPLWMTEMGFSARGQAAIFEIENADDWGLDAKAFALAFGERAAGKRRGASLGRDQARSRHSAICALCPRRPARPGKGQRAVRSDAASARSEAGVDRDRSRRGARCISSVAASEA